MSNRYFVDSPITSPRASLAGSEAHHLIHVMRAGPGSQVVLFDGSGCEFTARVIQLQRATVELEILDRSEIDRELPRAVTLGVALPKGDRQRWLVEKAVELGVRKFVPLKTARSVASPTESAIARLHKAVVEASKQCGRNRLMEIAAPSDWADFLASAPKDACRLAAHPLVKTGGSGSSIQELGDLASSKSFYLAVGPEGGLTGEEIERARAASWNLIDLGPRTLRIETAAELLVAIVTLAEGMK